jgi:hypothetical protein
MDIHEFAKKLDGRETGEEITTAERIDAKNLGFVVVFGYSDDNVEFRGILMHEVGCYSGTEILLDDSGILERCECKCKYYQEAIKRAKVIKAVWCGENSDGFAWTYETDIPHATFKIFKDEEKYCRGIVFDIKSLEV